MFHLLKIWKPVRPNDNEEICKRSEIDGDADSTKPVEADQVEDQEDHSEDQIDNGQMDPGHQKAGLCLKI